MATKDAGIAEPLEKPAQVEVVNSQSQPVNISAANRLTQLIFESSTGILQGRGTILADLDVSQFSQIRIAVSSARPNCKVVAFLGDCSSGDFIALLRTGDGAQAPGVYTNTIVLDIPGTRLCISKESMIDDGPFRLRVWGR